MSSDTSEGSSTTSSRPRQRRRYASPSSSTASSSSGNASQHSSRLSTASNVSDLPLNPSHNVPAASLANLRRGGRALVPAPAPPSLDSASLAPSQSDVASVQANEAPNGDPAPPFPNAGVDVESLGGMDQQDFDLADPLPAPGLAQRDASDDGEDSDISNSEEEDVDDDEAEPWEEYSWAAEYGQVLLRRVGRAVWVVQGWDMQKSRPTRRFHHLSVLDDVTTCDCPTDGACIHTNVYDLVPSVFTNAAVLSDLDPVPTALPFSLAPPYLASFSVLRNIDALDSGKRCVVHLDHRLRFLCASGCRSECNHAARARTAAIEHDILASEGEDGLGELGARLREELQQGGRRGPPKRLSMPAVTHACRGPPAFVRLDTAFDQALPFRPSPPLSTLPPLLSLDDHAVCRCGSGAKAGGLPTELPFVVFGLQGAVTRRIQVMPCGRCAKRKTGPDLLELGLVNWNNRVGFTREVFDRFLSKYTLSETTLVAFHASIIESYIDHRHQAPTYIPFCSEPTFRRAFFAFLFLLQLDSGMTCASCGPSPRVVILDGSVIGFESRRLTGHLRPPTLPTTSSKEKARVRSIPLSPLCADDLGVSADELGKLRKEARLWASLGSEVGGEWMPRLADAMEIVRGHDKAVGKSLVSLFEVVRAEESEDRRDVYRELVQQVVASTSIFSLFPPLAFPELDAAWQGHAISPTLKRLVPILAKLADWPLNAAVIELLSLLTARAKRVLAVLEQAAAHESPLRPTWNQAATAKEAAHPDLQDWRETGALYGKEPLRARALFPSVAQDAGSRRLESKLVGDNTITEDSCRKFYEQYGKKRGLIGGMCGAWCRHGVCLGAHMMPTAEGRDDVFAALFCYWEKAPSVIVYDYCCQLAKYCMLREPTFFKECLFLVDEFHGGTHKDCSTSSSLAAYMQVDPSLQKVNSSIAECAHACLGRISKSIGYMSEPWAKPPVVLEL